MIMDKNLKFDPKILLVVGFFLLSIIGFRNVFVLLIIGFIAYWIYSFFSHKKLQDFIPGVVVNGVNSKDYEKNNTNKYNFNSMNFLANPKKFIGGIIGGILLVWLFFASIVIIDAGEVGVYSFFGKVRDQQISPGFHLVNPLANVIKMSVRTEEYTMSKAQTEGRKLGDDSIPALTREGLNLTLDITVLFHLEPNKASDVYRNLGVNYEEKIIRPEVRSTIREVVAIYDSKDTYSEKRDEVVQKIKTKLDEKLAPRGVTVEDILLRDVTLPPNLATAIQEKLQADQEQQKYDFILQKEKKEADRKRIEAAGQRDSQKIINESLSTNYLYYQYINTLKDRQGTIYVPTNPSTGMPQFKELGK
jgi:regulator of protease activity HflC (stomatin/prohibitin superfamily)